MKITKQKIDNVLMWLSALGIVGVLTSAALMVHYDKTFHTGSLTGLFVLMIASSICGLSMLIFDTICEIINYFVER